MAHKTPIVAKTYADEKPQRVQLGRKEIGTFSQVGEFYDYSKFTPKRCLKRKDLRQWNMTTNLR